MTEGSVQVQLLKPADLPSDLLEKISNSPNPVISAGKTYMYISDSLFLCGENNSASTELMNVLHQQFQLKPKAVQSDKDAYRALLGKNDMYTIRSLADKFLFDINLPRIIVIFRINSKQQRTLATFFTEIAPVEKGDVMIEEDDNTVILVKDQSQLSDNDVYEFVSALIGTMEIEGITGIKAGIGQTAENLYSIHQSYEEAMEALHIGERFLKSENVYLYSRLMLERIIDSFSQETMEMLRSEAEKKRLDTVMNNELTETVRIFFKNDLNITATAKQLFIHRNTLIYRLEKIRKVSGLNLQHFYDAIIFRLLMTFTNSVNNSDSTERNCFI